MARLPLKPNEILVSRNKPFKVYMERVHKLLFTKQRVDADNMRPAFTSVFVSGMGACV